MIVTFLLVLAGICRAEGEGIWEQETLTNGFWGLNDQLADSGIELGFGITNVYQANVKGGTSTHNRRGRHSGSYELEMWVDFGEGALRYEHKYGHLVCVKCGKFEEIYGSKLEEIQHELVKKHGYVQKSHRLNIFGLCSRCAKEDTRKRSE